MRKKHKHKKQKDYVFNNVLRFVITLIPVYILVSLIYPRLSQQPTIPCANSISCKEIPQLKVENDAVGVFNNKAVTPPKIVLSQKDTTPSVLGTETGKGEKHIYVNLTKQKLYAYQGKKLFLETFISSGKWGRTPLGDFNIWVKLFSTRMTGGSGADFYDLPNVPFVMFFSSSEVPGSAGFSLHGTYWHNNFGHAMSHGCVNMRTIDAEKLYNWVNPPTNGYTTYAGSAKGTKITIYEEKSG